jgi:hypothetical protein
MPQGVAVAVGEAGRAVALGVVVGGGVTGGAVAVGDGAQIGSRDSSADVCTWKF